MKQILILILITSAVNAQVYQSINFNTSCYWVHDFHYYSGSGPTDCSSKFVAYVEKDTIVNSKQYWKVQGYFAAPITGFNCGDGSFWLHKTWITYLREDTLLKCVYKVNTFTLAETLLIDYNKQLGDSLSAPGNGGTALIDSITYVSVSGVNRRFQWSEVNFNYNFCTIEGIGTSHSFPFSGYGEWGVPMFTLICYGKDGISYYPDSSISGCTKLSPLKMDELNSDKFYLSIGENSVHITNHSNGLLRLNIFSGDGRNVASYEYGTGEFLNQLDFLSSGIYIIQARQEEKFATRKILIR